MPARGHGPRPPSGCRPGSAVKAASLERKHAASQGLATRLHSSLALASFDGHCRPAREGTRAVSPALSGPDASLPAARSTACTPKRGCQCRRAVHFVNEHTHRRRVDTGAGPATSTRSAPPAFLDAYSRKVLAWQLYLAEPSSELAAALFRRAFAPQRMTAAPRLRPQRAVPRKAVRRGTERCRH